MQAFIIFFLHFIIISVEFIILIPGIIILILGFIMLGFLLLWCIIIGLVLRFNVVMLELSKKLSNLPMWQELLLCHKECENLWHNDALHYDIK